MREIVLDTETTGLDPLNGDRIVEIGCVELINHLPTGRTFQRYLDPERPMNPEAAAVSGLTDEFLRGKPKFAEEVDAFLEFVADAAIVAHNAAFDLGFVNAELKRLGRPQFSADRSIDTVAIARRKFPGAQASLDALCRRFNIDLSARVKHGALLDAQLLARVYLELIGGREPGLGLVAETAARPTLAPEAGRSARPARAHAPTPDEAAAHQAFVAKIKNAIWTRA
ncbi:MAG: DNA polymerase III subunit epsilon [Rhodospirillaceae bacterium]|nr:DNA polymerase III subunit epsilon [Rhodospirillaceae bacterium]